MMRAVRAASVALVFCGAVGAQTYPNRPVRVIVPFPTGQASDTIMRLVGERLAKALGQPVIIDNKPGAGGNLGTDQGAKAAPDG